MELSVVIPTLNEENNISELIKHVKNVASELKVTFEIIIGNWYFKKELIRRFIETILKL